MAYKKFKPFEKGEGRKTPKPKGTRDLKTMVRMTPKPGDKVKLKNGKYAKLIKPYPGINGYIAEIGEKKAIVYAQEIERVINTTKKP